MNSTPGRAEIGTIVDLVHSSDSDDLFLEDTSTRRNTHSNISKEQIVSLVSSDEDDQVSVNRDQGEQDLKRSYIIHRSLNSPNRKDSHGSIVQIEANVSAWDPITPIVHFDSAQFVATHGKDDIAREIAAVSVDRRKSVVNNMNRRNIAHKSVVKKCSTTQELNERQRRMESLSDNVPSSSEENEPKKCSTRASEISAKKKRNKETAEEFSSVMKKARRETTLVQSQRSNGDNFVGSSISGTDKIGSFLSQSEVNNMNSFVEEISKNKVHKVQNKTKSDIHYYKGKILRNSSEAIDRTAQSVPNMSTSSSDELELLDFTPERLTANAVPVQRNAEENVNSTVSSMPTIYSTKSAVLQHGQQSSNEDTCEGNAKHNATYSSSLKPPVLSSVPPSSMSSSTGIRNAVVSKALPVSSFNSSWPREQSVTENISLVQYASSSSTATANASVTSSSNSASSSLQRFSIPCDDRLRIIPNLLYTLGYRNTSTFFHRGYSFSPSGVSDGLHDEASIVLKHLRDKEWQRSRHIIKSNYKRAIQTWRKPLESFIHHEPDKSSVPAVSRHNGPTIRKIDGPMRLKVVGTFQSHKNAQHEQEIESPEAAVSISQKVTSTHIESKPNYIYHAKKEKIRSTLQLDEDVVQMLESMASPVPVKAEPTETVIPVYNAVIPYISSIPFAWTWVPIPMNAHADEEAVLRSNPYFGDDDVEGVDTSHFEQIPGELETEISGEAEELTLFFLLNIYHNKECIYKALENILQITVSEIRKASERIQEGHWFREMIVPILAEAKQRLLTKNAALTEIQQEAILTSDTLAVSMYATDSRKELQALDKCGNDESIWEFFKHEAPSFHTDNPTNVQLGVGIGLGIPNMHDFDKLIANYQGLFCRRCFCYGCSEHNVEHPQPIVRRDPQPPFLCPVNQLTLPTDQVRSHIRPNFSNHRASVNLELFIQANKTNQVQNLRQSLQQQQQETNHQHGKSYAGSNSSSPHHISTKPLTTQQQVSSINQLHSSNGKVLQPQESSNTSASRSAEAASIEFDTDIHNSSVNRPALRAYRKRPRSKEFLYGGGDVEQEDEYEYRYSSARVEGHSSPSRRVSRSQSPSPSPASAVSPNSVGINSNNNLHSSSAKRFADSLYVDFDGTIKYLHSPTSTTPIIPSSSATIDVETEFKRHMWLQAGPFLLSKELNARREAIEKELEIKRQQQQLRGKQSILTLSNTNTTASTSISSSPILSPSIRAMRVDVASPIPLKEGSCSSDNHPVVVEATTTAVSFNPTDHHQHQEQVQDAAVWKSKLQVLSANISERTPLTTIIPPSVIIHKEDDMDELELYIRDFQSSSRFQPPVTDVELALIFKGLCMFKNSPPKSMLASYTENANTNHSTWENLISFIHSLLGTRTREEIQMIITQKTVISALLNRKQKTLEKEHGDNAGDASPIWTNIDDDIDAKFISLEDLLGLLPAISVDHDTKPQAVVKPIAIKNCFKSNYQPCHHPGPCSKQYNCVCADSDTFCEKFCACGPNCRIKVQGCKCKGGCRAKMCPCFAASRSCDPDLCGSCGASVAPWFRMDVCTFIQQGMHQTNIADAEEDVPRKGSSAAASSNSAATSNHHAMANGLTVLCSNISFSHRKKAKVYVGKSNIHGWGAFAGQRIERGEFIMEYTGELITQPEAERRGIIYDKYKSSYIFEANMYECIDATRKGNRARFFNHVRDEDATVVPKIMKINGDHRIGMFAKSTIEAGQELTFNYGYTGNSAPEWAHHQDSHQPGDSNNTRKEGSESTNNHHSKQARRKKISHRQKRK